MVLGWVNLESSTETVPRYLHFNWLFLGIAIKKGKDSFGWNYFNFYYWKIDFCLPSIFQQPYMVGRVPCLPLNKYQYQSFWKVACRLEENSLKNLVLTETKIMFFKIMDTFGFWYQPMVLGYVWPEYPCLFPQLFFQLVVDWDHHPKK